ncbi:methyltransferase domain-containing protein [Brevibacterium sp. RIT 803]|uniref:methyltransferase domain-containing protein n=1 Tax=Brevibacterium sp. RIT 803 TaxID=2810210 RepID=UPI001951A4AD|nr:methyltransferase domain-containing protein [Brevibacterium sp. RIT 803]MBM6589363.1 SAM-dependent methyltransferase [Brevibacterium sp. RIT 803]
MTLTAQSTYFGHGGTHPYERSLLGGGALTLRAVGDTSVATTIMDVDRYAADADAADLSVIEHSVGAVIDLGCGPGRMVRAAIVSGRFALGIDVSATAVAMAHDSGLPVLRHDINDTLPLEGKWGTALLLDGNIGIGGDPHALLNRARLLVNPKGLVIVETSAADGEERCFLAEVRDRCGRSSGPFPWAQIGAGPLIRIAAELGLQVEACWSVGDEAEARKDVESEAEGGEDERGADGEGGGVRTFLALSA